MFIAFAVDGQFQPVRQGVHNRHANAVQAAGNLVGVLVEFPARMELGHDHFGRRSALCGVHAHRDAAAIVGDFGRAVREEGDRDPVCMAGKRFIDGIVHDLVDHVVQARAVIGVTDIHAGAFADRFKALQDLD